jgi:hypothetical protein
MAPMAKAKLTLSVKRRLANGDEVFIAPGLEMDCSADAMDAAMEDVTAKVNGWMDTLLEAYPDNDPIEADEDEEEADEEADEDEDEEEADEEDEDEITEEDIAKMKLADLKKLAADYEIELTSKKVADVREELLEALFEDEQADEEDEDEDEDEDEEAFTEEDLDAMKLSELQELVDEWEIEHPTFKKGTKLPAKKAAYIALILEVQDEEDEDE